MESVPCWVMGFWVNDIWVDAIAPAPRGPATRLPVLMALRNSLVRQLAGGSVWWETAALGDPPWMEAAGSVNGMPISVRRELSFWPDGAGRAVVSAELGEVMAGLVVDLVEPEVAACNLWPPIIEARCRPGSRWFVGPDLRVEAGLRDVDRATLRG